MYPKEMIINRRDLANAIRVLTMDAVHQARSGHPGAPMGMADAAEVLWNDFLKHNPANPRWPDRDRFVLSNGHASMLIYSLLHLTGYELSIDDIKQFRQLHSKTPGHPEYGRTPGVESTTGTLGQGLSNAVGMALAERTLAAQFNRPGHVIVDHFTYVIVGDGCLMEGVSHEACSLAGTQGLGKLIVLYDDNGISIDGPVTAWFRDDTPKRFEAYGWHVAPEVDAHDTDAVFAATEAARAASDRPSLICCKNVIGWGSPNQQGTESCHGAPLDDGEADLVRQTIGWPHEPFMIPAEIYAAWNARGKGARVEAEWRGRFDAYRQAYPELAREFERRMAGELPAGWEESTHNYLDTVGHEPSERIATRKGSQMALNAYGPLLPEMIGGSADLTESNLTFWSRSKDINRENPGGNYMHYGAREFAMCALNNGIALHGGFLPYAGTFLMFCEYALNALRMAAIMKIRTIFVYTHDSIGVGEDGPTHQPVEQASHLRRIPNMHLWRPCDSREAAVAWKAAIERRDGPTCLLLTRQAVIHQDRQPQDPEVIARGGYVRLDCSGPPEAIVIATGSEVPLAIAAARQLNEQGRCVRVVSMPSTHVFDAQAQSYREQVLPDKVWARVAIEAGLSEFWLRYVGPRGKVIGIDTFGESAPFHVAFRHFGFTAENVIAAVEGLLAD